MGVEVLASSAYCSGSCGHLSISRQVRRPRACVRVIRFSLDICFQEYSYDLSVLSDLPGYLSSDSLLKNNNSCGEMTFFCP